MRRSDKQVTDLQALHDLIQRVPVCRIALTDGQYPYLVPLSFGFDGTYVYFHSAREGKKVDLLHANPHICLEWEDGVEIVPGATPCRWSCRYRTVIAQGTVELLVDVKEKRYALDQITRHYAPQGTWEPFTEEQLNPVVVYRVTLTELTGKADVEG